MSKVYVVYKTEGWYDGTCSKILGVFEKRDPAVKFLHYKVKQFEESTEGVELDTMFDAENECYRKFNDGNYHDWDTCDTTHYGYKMEAIELSSDIIIQNKGVF